MIVKSKEDTKLSFPDFALSGSILQVSDEVKYLGGYITADMSDDRNIYKQHCMKYVQANMLLQKFSKCTL